MWKSFPLNGTPYNRLSTFHLYGKKGESFPRNGTVQGLYGLGTTNHTFLDRTIDRFIKIHHPAAERLNCMIIYKVNKKKIPYNYCRLYLKDYKTIGFTYSSI